MNTSQQGEKRRRRNPKNKQRLKVRGHQSTREACRDTCQGKDLSLRFLPKERTQTWHHNLLRARWNFSDINGIYMGKRTWTTFGNAKASLKTSKQKMGGIGGVLCWSHSRQPSQMSLRPVEPFVTVPIGSPQLPPLSPMIGPVILVLPCKVICL